MAHVWTKITHTHQMDGIAIPNSEEPMGDYIYSSDLEFRVIEQYSLAGAGNTYRWKREIRYIDGNGDPYYSIWGEVELIQTSTEQTLRYHHGDENWTVSWVRSTSNYPMIDLFGHGTIFPAGGYGAGTRQLWETVYHNDVAQGPEVLVKTFDIRRFSTRAYSDKQMFNPLKENTAIKLDFFTEPAPGDSTLFPNGWTPSAIDWELDFSVPWNLGTTSSKAGVATLLNGIGVDGKVAVASFPWNGRTDHGTLIELNCVGLAPI